MIKKFLASFIVCIFILGITNTSANAYYIQKQDNEYENNPNVDVFKPTSGAKITPSPLAQMMENATKNATQKNNQATNQQKKSQQQKNQSSWF